MPTETPREPDRFEAKARELIVGRLYGIGDKEINEIAVALRREREEALERAAQVVEQRCYNHGPRPVSWCEYCRMAGKVRALASPAAAPAAETCKAAMVEDGYPYRCTLPPRHAGPHKENDYAEWDNTADVAQVAPLSEPVAPAGSVTDLLRETRGYLAALGWEHADGLVRRIDAALASPAAQGKETRKP